MRIGKQMREGDEGFVTAFEKVLKFSKGMMLEMVNKTSLGEVLASHTKTLEKSIRTPVNLLALFNMMPQYFADPLTSNPINAKLNIVKLPEFAVKSVVVLPEGQNGQLCPLPTTLQLQYLTGKDSVVDYVIDTVVLESTMRDLVLVLRRDHGKENQWYVDGARFSHTSHHSANVIMERLIRRGMLTYKYSLLLYVPKQ